MHMSIVASKTTDNSTKYLFKLDQENMKASHY